MTKTKAKKIKVGTVRADGKVFWCYYDTLAGPKEFWVSAEKFADYVVKKKAKTKEWWARKDSVDVRNFKRNP